MVASKFNNLTSKADFSKKQNIDVHFSNSGFSCFSPFEAFRILMVLVGNVYHFNPAMFTLIFQVS